MQALTLAGVTHLAHQHCMHYSISICLPGLPGSSVWSTLHCICVQHIVVLCTMHSLACGYMHSLIATNLMQLVCCVCGMLLLRCVLLYVGSAVVLTAMTAPFCVVVAADVYMAC